MKNNIKKHIKPIRFNRLPEAILQGLKSARLKRDWSQAELGQRVGLPQMHISRIESGKTVPRFDTLLELARTLDFDILMIPRPLVPVVQALVRDHYRGYRAEERPLYTFDDESEEGTSHDEV